MIRTDRFSEIVNNVWQNIEYCHRKVMETKTIKQFEKAQKRWAGAIIKGAEIIKQSANAEKE